MLSTSSKYAIKALIHIVQYSSEKNKIPVKNLAEKTNIPQAYLSKLLHQLTAKAFLASTKGPHGGFFIKDDQLERSILDVLIEVEGKDSLQLCVLNLENCNARNPCPIHSFVSNQKDELRISFQKIKLKNLKFENVIENL